MSPQRGSARGQAGAGGAALRRPQGGARDVGFLSAGFAARYFVALIDSNRRVTARLSGFAATLDEGLAFLRWARRRHVAAVLVRELHLFDVLE